MRDNFSIATKDLLAKRVAWQCSFSGCGIITVGPGHESDSAIVNLGEAAHIYAASKDGPRYNEYTTSEERKSIENGIWMCRHHARMIDADFINFSAETLKQWKRLAEEKAYKHIKNLERYIDYKELSTLIAIGPEIIFLGIWMAAKEDMWVFSIKRFIMGDICKLREYNDSQLSKYNRYVVVETQGDGRLLKGKLSWELKDGALYQITIETEPKIESTSPYDLVDIEAQITIENGDFKLVKGIDCAKQDIISILSTNFGELWYAEDFGSHFSSYYWEFKDDLPLLNRLLKLEVTRLISVPHFDKETKNATPPLRFINRIVEVQVISTKLSDSKIPIRLKLEWGDGKYWEDEVKIYVRLKTQIGVKKLDSFENSGLNEELFNILVAEFRGLKK